MNVVSIVVEGVTDEPICRKLLQTVGLDVGAVYGQKGKAWLDDKLKAYNNAAKLSKWFVLRDLDNDADCPAALVKRLLPFPAPGICFRISVKAVEAWLLADREAIAQFLGVPIARIPPRPDEEYDPKARLVAIARRSRRQNVRADMVPTGHTVRVGPGYTARISEFAADHWRPVVAARNSPSLSKCLKTLTRWEFPVVRA